MTLADAELSESEAERAAAEGRFDDAAAHYAVAVELALSVQPQPRSLIARCCAGCAVGLMHTGRVDDAVEWLLYGFGYAMDEATAARLAHHLATAYSELGNYDEAIRLHESNLPRVARLGSEGGLSPAVTLQALGAVLGEAGQLDRAVEMLEQARVLLTEEHPSERCALELNLAMAYGLLRNSDRSTEAFRDALEAASDDLQLRMAGRRFLEGMYVGLELMIEPESDLWRARLKCVEAGQLGDYRAALVGFADVAEQAWECNDILTTLQSRANIVTCHDLLGDLSPTELQREAAEIRATSLEWDLAPAAALADLALLSILTSGVEANDTGLSRVQLAVEAVALANLTAQHAMELEAHARGRVPVIDAGIALAFLAVRARECRAYGVALEYLYESLRWAEELGDVRSQVTRIAALMEVAELAGAKGLVTEATTERLRSVVQSPALDARSHLTGLVALGTWSGASARQALVDLRAASHEYERLRSEYPTDLEVRATGDRLHAGLLAACLRVELPPADAYEALQSGRARDLLDALASLTDGRRRRPPSADQAARMVNELPSPTTAVDIVATDGGLSAFLVDERGVRRVEALGDVSPLRHVQFGDARRRSIDVVALTLESPLLRELVAVIEAETAPGRGLLLTVDQLLANLPLHAVPYEGAPWAEARPIGRIAAIGMLDFADADPATAGPVVAGDSRGDLPHAAAECVEVADRLGVSPMLGQQCTFEAVSAALRDAHRDIVHLALHGRGDVRRGGRASLLFADGEGGTQWVPFDDLVRLPWRSKLLVFSGCSTAVGGPRDGFGLNGIAQAAAYAGARTVVATLWPVDDLSTRIFMTCFYEELGRQRSASDRVDLRTVMDHARAGLRGARARGGHERSITRARDGRTDQDQGASAGAAPAVDQGDPWVLHWAPFTLMGDPVVRFGAQ